LPFASVSTYSANMARPLRIEFPGAVYHVTSRGNRREPIFVDDEDRRSFLDCTAQALVRFDAQMLAYCLMGNHYHFVLHTRQPNLSRLMRHINGVYTQSFNRRHAKGGHLFQGRFKAILVDRDGYLLQVCRYVELNPVAAKIVKKPQAWPWSSYRSHVGLEATPAWLDTDGLHAYVSEREVHTTVERRRAAARYADLVASAPNVPLWDSALRQQIYLGDESFVERMQALAEPHRSAAREVPKAQRRKPRSLAQWLSTCQSREEALYSAYTQSGIRMSEMAKEMGLSVSRVSRLIARWEQAKGKT
jgi:putative transposase